ncbi:hypothetical protein A3I40_00065 [Candidatus Uhrbacteria bacterium RIFCSPLOWO2_02_FULL_48_12]|uniref:Solute-binding protein family 5 domain-containing protein n=1 Tax=Candidatus Uhrbacteria bacterium RIFCSPLOWO2_02_FULL_48_12 TaxID=1802407 RepID=A0A1F7V551_9BACT|nr:MAG: hypothetical protein A3I40_00065 [Candidatus Uhrbacteria bacterium RIFCSPLOWO2_02_FULL_48_12]
MIISRMRSAEPGKSHSLFVSSTIEQTPIQPNDAKSPPAAPEQPPEIIGPENDERVPSEEPPTPAWRQKLDKLLGVSKHAIESTANLERQLIFSLNPKRWPTLKQLRHCGRVLAKRERQTLLGCAIVIIVATMWLAARLLLGHFQTVPTSGGSYTEAMIGQPQFINPVFASTSAVDADITRLIFSGLFKYNEKLEIENDLAANYTVSADGRVYTIILRDNLTWHDSEPLTVDDAIFTFTSIADSDVKSPLRPSFRNVAIEKVDDHTIRFTLKDPYRGFLNLLTVGLIPQHIWGEIPRGEWRGRLENLQPIGSGAWQFNALERDTSGNIKTYILNPTANQPPAGAGASTPLLDRLIFKFYPDEDQALEALKSQSAEGLAMVSRATMAILKGGKHLAFHEMNLRATTAIFFNLNQSSPVADVVVRRALKNAIDKRRLMTEILPQEATMNNDLWNATTNGQNGKDAAADEDAEALLTKAGWEKIGAIRKNKNGETLNITLTIIDREPDRTIGRFVQEEWRQVGVETKIDLISPPTPENVQRTALRPRAYEALLYTTAYGTTYDPYPFWHSSQRVDPGLNLSLFSNHEADAAIERGRRATSDETEKQAYLELQKIISSEAPAVFLFMPVRLYAMSDDIKGVNVDKIASPADRFNGLNKWHVKTKIRFKW